MTGQEIETYRKEISKIIAIKNARESQLDRAKELAMKVGASMHLWHEVGGEKEGNISVVVHNIHFALQTASMANMCEIASKGHKTAIQACKSAKESGKRMAIIAVISLIIAGLSVVAVIVGIIKN